MSGIVYIHVPKCGGTTFGAALRMRHLLSQASITLNQGDPRLTGDRYIQSDYDARDAELMTLMQKKVKLISGHVRYSRSLHQLGRNKYSFVTALRDPVQRFVSHYQYLQRKHPNPERPSTLVAFLETEDARRIASQYLFYFARRYDPSEVDTPRLIQKAITNLSRFKIVGDLSEPAAFKQSLQHLVGGPLPTWRRNKAPVTTFIPPSLERRIAKLCSADIQIYRSVRSMRMAA